MDPTRPLRARYWKINRLVARVLEDNQVNEPHVRVEKIVKKYGIRVLKGDLQDVSGLLMRKPDEVVIGVNSTQSRNRQRFTIAHELGHFLLHDGISSHVDRDYRINFRSAESSQATNIEEVEANYFSASLLMPSEFLFRDNAVEALDSNDAVAELARRYQVSQHAMSLRLANLYGDHRPY